MKKLQKGDTVVVIAGKDKGSQGQVEKVLENNKLLITNVNLAKKHVKPNPEKGVQGGIESINMPIDASNVAILNPETNKADRVGFKIQEDGKKDRFFKSNNQIIA